MALVALMLGAALNMASGVRRPLVERAELARNHYREADAAAAAVRRHVSAGEPLELVVFDGDKLEPGTLRELDGDIWADYRFKWLLHPRRIQVTRITREGRRVPDPRYPGSPTAPRYQLLFRVTPPTIALSSVLAGSPQRLAAGNGWLLAREAGLP